MFSKINIKKIGVNILPIFVLFLLVIPIFAHGAIVYVCNNGGDNGNCTFNDLIQAVTYLTNWGSTFALSFSVVVIAYAGFKYMISGDNAGERKKANEMLRKVAIGMILIILAWVIVTLITKALVNSNINTFLK